MSDSLFKYLRPDNTEATVPVVTAKITVGWSAWFAGINLGDIATIAAIIYTVLNIIFLLYDRLIKKSSRKDSVLNVD